MEIRKSEDCVVEGDSLNTMKRIGRRLSVGLSVIHKKDSNEKEVSAFLEGFSVFCADTLSRNTQ